MKYQPMTAVWEVTMGCNMRCKHCGSSCEEPLQNELNTKQALDLCDQIADIGLRWITLSGGEPLIRKDITKIIHRLHEKGVTVNVITNGWLLDQAMAEQLKASNISTVAISIDGPERIHDRIRKKGSFARARKAFEHMKDLGIRTGVVTTISGMNFSHLDELKEDLIQMGVETWQVQLGLPMGNFHKTEMEKVTPEQVDDIIDFCHKTALEGRIRIYPADCIGYYTKKEMDIKRISYQTDQVSLWDGCNAGLRSFGVLHNGDILGCTSIRDKEFVEGNITKRPLKEIWEDENNFLWRRNLTKDQLTGSCKSCSYSGKCLGGCPNTRLTMKGSIHAENEYCAYNLQMKRYEKHYGLMEDEGVLMNIAQKLVRENSFQQASYAFKQVIRLNPDNIMAHKSKAFCEYMCGNYETCKNDNLEALKRDDSDPYALKGLGIATHMLGDSVNGISYVKKAAKITGYKDLDILNDLKAMERQMAIK